MAEGAALASADAGTYVSVDVAPIPEPRHPMLTDHDTLTQHCPMLGHEIPFSYCRQPGQEIPCRKIYDCWWETFDVKSFIESNFSKETKDAILQPPKPKILSLMEIIEQASKRSSAVGDHQ